MVTEHVWIKYALMAALLHAAILALPLSNKGQDRIERVIDLVVMRQEPAPAPDRKPEKPLLIARRPAQREIIPEIKDEPRNDPPPQDKSEKKKNEGTLAEIPASPASLKKEETPPAGGGNVLDERIIAQLTPGPGPGTGSGVAISGLASRGGTVGIGSGGAGSSRGSGNTGASGVATGTGEGSGIAPGRSGGPVDSGFGQPDGPQFVYRAMPEYPFVARRLRKEGRVVLMVVIDEKGALQKIDVVESSDQMFAASAIEALKRSTFLPAKRRGVPVSSRATLPIRFALRD